jgi:hypothetical protein
VSSQPFIAGAGTVAELRQLIEASFARGRDGRRPRGASVADRKGPDAEDGLGPIRRLELARQRLMERLPRIQAGEGTRRHAAADSGREQQKAAS